MLLLPFFFLLFLLFNPVFSPPFFLSPFPPSCLGLRSKNYFKEPRQCFEKFQFQTHEKEKSEGIPRTVLPLAGMALIFLLAGFRHSLFHCPSKKHCWVPKDRDASYTWWEKITVMLQFAP